MDFERHKIQQNVTAYGEFSPPSIKRAISAGLDQNGRGFSADLINRLMGKFCMLGRKRTRLSIWFLGHVRTAVHTIRLLPNSFRDESTISCSFSVVISKRTTQPNPAINLALRFTRFSTWPNQPVLQPLMVSFRVKMNQKLGHGISQRFFPK